MKKIILSLLLCCAFVVVLQAQHNEVSYSKLNNVFNLKVKNSAEKLTLTINGDVKLGDDDKSITAISDDGAIYYRKKDQSLKVEEDGKGNLLYTINGNKKPNLSAADKVLVEACVALLIDYGVDADSRVKRIYAKSGSTGVLNEVERFESDYVKEIYLSYLLKNQKLSKAEMVTLLKKADQYLSSDYYKAELLDGVMTSFLADEATSNTYLETVNNISSDYYQSETIKKLLGASLNENQYDQVMVIVGKMKSDYYQAEVLKKLLSNNDISDTRFEGLMHIAGNMQSDYYKAEIIGALLKNKALNKDRYNQTIAAVQNMKSGYYQYEILSNLIDSNMKDEAAWSSLIQYAGKIDSDYYQAEMLMKIADKMPASEALRKAISDAARNIKSDYYYGKVMRSVEKRA